MPPPTPGNRHDDASVATAASALPCLPSWLAVTDRGLYCRPGRFYIDPQRAVSRAVLTHGHGDHARPGHAAVLATAETLAILRARYGNAAGRRLQALAYGTPLVIDGVTVTLVPAGHILGSAQVRIDYGGDRAVVSGDYKRRPDPTCPPFEPVPCDLFITEATFGLPMFRHPPESEEIDRLLASLAAAPHRAHLIGVYALGKCQRLIALLRRAGYDRPIFLHGALTALCTVYERHGIALGPLAATTGGLRRRMAGEIVLCPPAAIADRWARRFPDPVTGLASGWMSIRQRAGERGVALPLVISDHADWNELTQTLDDVGAPTVLVTHGREDALVHHARSRGYRAAALSLAGTQQQGHGPR